MVRTVAQGATRKKLEAAAQAMTSEMKEGLKAFDGTVSDSSRMMIDDSSVMNAGLFRRDQIWLTEKRGDGSTDMFSLYDFDASSRPRKSEALEKNYLAGRYGAVPNFGPTFEDLEVR